MKRIVYFTLPDSYKNERIISVKLDRQSKGAMWLMIESCSSDFKVAARDWLEARGMLPCYQSKKSGHATAVINKAGRVGISSYREGDSIPYDSYLGVYLAIADSYGVKQEMMKDIGMV